MVRLTRDRAHERVAGRGGEKDVERGRERPRRVVAMAGHRPLDPGALLGMPAGLARGRALALPSGQQLLVGQSLAPHEEIKRWIGRTLLGALLLTTLLGFAGSYAIARAVARGSACRSSSA